MPRSVWGRGNGEFVEKPAGGGQLAQTGLGCLPFLL